MPMLASIRRYGTVILIFVTCTAILLSYDGWNTFEQGVQIPRTTEIDDASQEGSYYVKFSDRNVAPTKQTKSEFRNFSSSKRIRGKAIKPPRKADSPLHYTTKFPPTRPTQISEKRTEVRNTWSKSWPQIHIGNCSHIEYINRGQNSEHQFEAQSFPTTGLISFPGSGNTWTRHLIQQATGLWTGSVYMDQSLYEGGFRAELDDCNDKGSVVIKAHYPIQGAQSYCKFDRAIIVMRDPYRAVLSEFNWRTTSKHTGIADPRLYQTISWKKHVIKRTETWLSTTRIWIERFYTKTPNHAANEDRNPFLRNPASSNTLLMVSYERMKENPAREMERIFKFLQLKTFRRHCVEVGQAGNFRRKSYKSESIDCLFEKFDLKSTVEKSIRILADRTIEIGLGDVTTEFEGPGGEVVSEKCRHA